MEKLLKEFYQLNNERKQIEKKLKVLKQQIIEEIYKADNRVIEYGSYFATLKEQSRSIIDQESLKQLLGAARFESFKRVTTFDKLDVIKKP